MLFEGHKKRVVRFAPLSLCVVLSIAVAQGVSGQTPSPTPIDTMPVAPVVNTKLRPLPDPSRVGVDLTDQLSLTLEQAIEMALKNNNDLEASRKDIKISEFSIRGTKGVYDPLINSQSYFESRTTPVASTIGGAVGGSVTQRQFFNDFGLSGFTPKFGGSYDVIFNSARSTSTNRNSTLNPQYPSSLVATYIQPLWRNLSIDNNRRSIEIAKKNLDISDSQLQLTAIDVVSTTEQAYWNLVFSLRNLQVQVETLKQAREQFESNERLVNKGVLAPIEIVAAKVQISTFEQNIYTAQEAVTNNENTLKTLLLPNRTSAEWSRPLMPVTPVSITIPKVGLEVAITEALKNRPEISQLELTAEINRIDRGFLKNQTKPQIDLVGSYTSAGLAGTKNPLSSGSASVPPNLVGGYFTSLGTLLQQEYPTYRVGVQISLPWGNRVAKANLGRNIVEGERLTNVRAQAEQMIEAEVRNAIQALRSAEARLNSSTDARAAAEELYASEQRQFRAGTTTFFLVAQRQTELLTARSRELQAQTDLNVAISVFYRATGATLTVNNVSVAK